MPATTSANLKLPRTLSDLRTLKYFPSFSPFSISYKNSFFLGFCLIGIKITCFVSIYVSICGNCFLLGVFCMAEINFRRMRMRIQQSLLLGIVQRISLCRHL
jgi:hypothetical protein